MRRFAPSGAQVGSSAVEIVMVGALLFLVVGAVVGVALLTLGPRSNAGGTASSAFTGSPVAVVPAIEIACGADGASIEGQAVDATLAGVPVRIVGDVGAVLSFVSSGIPGYRMRVFEPSGVLPASARAGCLGRGLRRDGRRERLDRPGRLRRA